MTDFIRGFFDEYRFLSNFWFAEVEYDDVVYPTNEHAFQAAKFDDLAFRKVIQTAQSPGAAKRIGATREYPLREGWDAGVAVQVMGELNAQKYANHPELKKQLLTTGDAILVETNHWGDDTWGDSTTTATPGKNQLGLILMTVRAALRAAK